MEFEDVISQDVSALSQAIAAPDGFESIAAYLELTRAEIEANGADVNEVLPSTGEQGIGFGRHRIDSPVTFWTAILGAAQQTLCPVDSKTRPLLIDGTSLKSAPLIVAVLMVSLGLPAYAIGIATLVAAIILTVGINGMCSWFGAQLSER